MLLFRSEEHLDTWLDQRSLSRGATMSLEQQWRLARIWYSGSADRRDPEWARRTPDEAQAIFDDLGLTGDAWRIT